MQSYLLLHYRYWPPLLSHPLGALIPQSHYLGSQTILVDPSLNHQVIKCLLSVLEEASVG